MNSKIPKIAVVIPYFQRERGILRGTVQSILSVTNLDDYQIIIVDDESPVPAEDELATIADTENRIRLVKQSNAGPGAARNTGLDNVMEGTQYVALLDSDDQWRDDFLADAVYSLDRGYDIFVGNSRRVGQEKSRLEWSNVSSNNINACEHLLIDSDRNIYEYQGDFFDLLIHHSSIIGPATMAYRYDKFRSVRYNTTLFNGQDRLFKLSLREATHRVAFSPKIYAEEGEGVNIFDRSQWGSERSLGFLSSYVELKKTIIDEIEMNQEQQKFVLSQLSTARYSLVASLFHLISSGKPVDWQVIYRTFRNDPMTAILFLPNAAKVVFNKMFSGNRSSHAGEHLR